MEELTAEERHFLELNKRGIAHDLQRCVHFNGVQNKICRMGVAYDDVKDANQSPYRFPCLHPEVASSCVQLAYPTEEEVIAENITRHREAQKFFSQMEQGICPTCNQPMTKTQVGPCVYAHPCGHRLYQGTI